MPGEDDARQPYDPFAGPDLRYELRAADIVRELVEPSTGRWRRRPNAASSPSYHVVGRYITGVLDLRGADLDFLLHFEDCHFAERPDVRESQLLGLSFVGCALPGLRARNLRCRNDVRLTRCQVNLDPDQLAERPTSMALAGGKERGVPNAAVILTDAVVEGSVVLSGSVINYPGGRAIQADRLKVSGALMAYRLGTDGEVRLPGLRTGGNVNFSGAQLRNLGGIALNGTGAHIGGSLLCERDIGRKDRGEQAQDFSAKGILFVPGARVDGDMVLRGADLEVQPGGGIALESWQYATKNGDPSVDPWPAMVGDRLQLHGNLICTEEFTSDGTLRFVHAVIGGSFRLTNAKITVQPRPQVPHYDRALHLDGSEISGDLQAGHLESTGQLRLADVRIGGNLLAHRADLKHPGRDVLSARRSTVAGNVQLTDGKLHGTLQLQGLHCGGSVELYGTELKYPEERNTRSYSLDLRGVVTGRDVVLTSNGNQAFLATGGVNLDGAKIGRKFNLTGAVLQSLPETDTAALRGVALDASDVIADEFVLTPGVKPDGRVILRRARCATLEDNQPLWNSTGGLELEDFRYDALRTPIALEDDQAVERRIERLRKAMRGYRPGPYDQLAAMLRASGNEEHASTVLLRKQQYRYEALATGAGALGPGVRAWSWLQRAVVGYGYRPTRALGWLFLLLVLGSLWFGLVPDSCIEQPKRYTVSGPRCPVNKDDTGLEWNPVLHTADLLVPIVDLGNKGRWHMGGADKWVATGFIAAGWILATTVAAGVTRMLRRP